MNPEALATLEGLVGPVKPDGIETLREEKCFRVPLLQGDPASVIVKMSSGEEAERLHDEWAGLAFINEVAPGSGLVPRLYGGDPVLNLFVFEDFGKPGSVADALIGDNPDRAREALALHAEAVAGLHAATVGKEDRFWEIRKSFGPISEVRDGMGWGDLRRSRSDLELAFESVGQTVGAEFWDEYEALASAIEDSSPFRALVHNDSCPDNTILEPDRVRLIDFERVGYHACLVDAAYCRLCMPHCWLSQRLPEDVTPMVERRYRDRVASAIPEALDNQIFGQRMTEACAYWIVSSRIWMVHTSMENDFQWGASTWRQRVLMRLDQFARTTEEFSHLPEMGRAARDTRDRLLKVWSVEPMPLYHALR